MVIISLVEEGSSAPSKDFLQSRFWATFKCLIGWSSLRLRVQDDGSAGYEISILIRKLAGPFSFAYIPHGPELECSSDNRQIHLVALAEVLKDWLPRYCLFLRFDPAWYETNPAGTNPARPEIGRAHV